MQVNRRQRDALRAYVTSSYEKRGLLGSSPPWAELLSQLRTSSELASLSDNELWFAVHDSISAPAEIERDSAIDRATDSAVQCLESLPREYFLYVTLPSFLAPDLDLEVSHALNLISRKQVGTRIVGGDGGLTLTVATPPTQQTLLRAAVSGYVSGLSATSVVNRYIGSFKQCWYLFTSQGVAHRHWTQARSSGYIEERSSGRRIDVFLPDEIARRMGELGHNASAGGDLLQPHPAEPSPFDVELTREAVARVNAFFSRNGTVPGFERVTAAIEWLFDSETAADQTMGYLAACIGVESILGDEDNGELHTARLADRYAFMLGDDRIRRVSLSKNFLQAFAVRGKLVHARQQRLSRDDQTHLRSIQAILRDILVHEIDQITVA